MDGEEGGNGGSDLVYGVEKNGGLVNATGNHFNVFRVHEYRVLGNDIGGSPVARRNDDGSKNQTEDSRMRHSGGSSSPHLDGGLLDYQQK
ncbi:hypothetical protein IGI04_013680 [Brassica rapa subsp. trilocularis]|uniref:Uncharacterized protein n=1 Tax=Brassica rapa subsp. trilocularis TaxID=1813537 RepID=A0ABQ7NBH8_BRACM|nr:hypothetical protein IGI04_013680 [Brassica rapa subsp. trilocularis]